MIEQNFLKLIWKGKQKEWIHKRFSRYFKGKFKGPQLKLQRNKEIKVRASVSYVNMIGEILAKLSNKLFIKGAIYSQRKIKPELPIKGDATRKGKWKGEALKIEGEIDADKLNNSFKKFRSAWFL